MEEGEGYYIEYSRNTAACTGPKAACIEGGNEDRQILRGELRLGVSYEINYGLNLTQTQWKWRHWRCVSADMLKNIGSPDKLMGLDQLAPQDQQRVRRALALGHVPEYTAAHDLVEYRKMLARQQQEAQRAAARQLEKAAKEQARAAAAAQRNAAAEAAAIAHHNAAAAAAMVQRTAAPANGQAGGAPAAAAAVAVPAAVCGDQGNVAAAAGGEARRGRARGGRGRGRGRCRGRGRKRPSSSDNDTSSYASKDEEAEHPAAVAMSHAGPAAAADIDDGRLMHILAEAGVSAEQRVALAQLLGLQSAGPGVGPAAAAAAARSGQRPLVSLEPMFTYLQLLHPQLCMLLQRKAQQVMMAQQQQSFLQQQQQQQQRAGMPGVTAPAAGMRLHMMRPTGPAAAAAAPATAAGAVPQHGFGGGEAIGRDRRRTGGKKKRDADFYGDSDEEYNVDEPSEYEPRLHRTKEAAVRGRGRARGRGRVGRGKQQRLSYDGDQQGCQDQQQQQQQGGKPAGMDLSQVYAAALRQQEQQAVAALRPASAGAAAAAVAGRNGLLLQQQQAAILQAQRQFQGVSLPAGSTPAGVLTLRPGRVLSSGLQQQQVPAAVLLQQRQHAGAMTAGGHGRVSMPHAGVPVSMPPPAGGTPPAAAPPGLNMGAAAAPAAPAPARPAGDGPTPAAAPAAAAPGVSRPLGVMTGPANAAAGVRPGSAGMLLAMAGQQLPSHLLQTAAAASGVQAVFGPGVTAAPAAAPAAAAGAASRAPAAVGGGTAAGLLQTSAPFVVSTQQLQELGMRQAYGHGVAYGTGGNMQHMQQSPLPGLDLLTGRGSSSPIRADIPGSPAASSSSVSNTFTPHPPLQHVKPVPSQQQGQGLGSSAGFPAAATGVAPAPGGLGGLGPQNPGPQHRAPHAAWGSVMGSPENCQAGGPDGVIKSPDGLSDFQPERLPSWGPSELQADMAVLGGMQMHMLDAADDAEPVSPASAERLLREGSGGGEALGNGLAGAEAAAAAAAGNATQSAPVAAGAVLQSGMGQPGSMQQQMNGGAGTKFGGGAAVIAHPAPVFGAVSAPSSAVGGVSGVQQVPPALYAEYVRIVMGLPESVRGSVLQQVGPSGIADFVRAYHERTAPAAAAANRSGRAM